jgi:hypothetical protein
MDCSFERDIFVKQGVVLRPIHFLYAPVGLIVQIAYVMFPAGYPLWITRGAEECPGGKPNSKHLICCAFDFRTRHLSPAVNRKALVSKMQVALGHQYYGYYKIYVNNAGTTVEWIHFQYNGGL